MYAAASSPFSVGSISAGALLGTTGSADLVRSINDSLGGSNLASALQESWREASAFFRNEVLAPIQAGSAMIAQRVNILMNPDVIRPLIDNIDFTAIPPCMYEPIILFPPVRALLEQGRISGFGFDPQHLPTEDVWGRLIDNGTCYDVLNNLDADGRMRLIWEFRSTDPKVSFAELDAIELTRKSIERLINTTRLDPTDILEERG